MNAARKAAQKACNQAKAESENSAENQQKRISIQSNTARSVRGVWGEWSAHMQRNYITAKRPILIGFLFKFRWGCCGVCAHTTILDWIRATKPPYTGNAFSLLMEYLRFANRRIRCAPRFLLSALCVAFSSIIFPRFNRMHAASAAYAGRNAASNRIQIGLQPHKCESGMGRA